jgi:copper chaperone CopZ
MMMKSVLFTFAIATFLMNPVISSARTVEVEVYGMTCAFCVDNLTRKFDKMDSVNKVDISLKLKKIRLETNDNSPTIENINQSIIDAGFTPVKTTVLPDDIK